MEWIRTWKSSRVLIDMLRWVFRDGARKRSGPTSCMNGLPMVVNRPGKHYTASFAIYPKDTMSVRCFGTCKSSVLTLSTFCTSLYATHRTKQHVEGRLYVLIVDFKIHLAGASKLPLWTTSCRERGGRLWSLWYPPALPGDTPIT